MKRLVGWGLWSTTLFVAPAALADTADGAALIGQDWDAIVRQAHEGQVNCFCGAGPCCPTRPRTAVP